jgi:hypothetical protein
MPSAWTSGTRTRPDAPPKTAPTYRNNASIRSRVTSRSLSPPHPHPATTLPSQARSLYKPPAAPPLPALDASWSTAPVSRCMQGPRCPSVKRGRARGASDSEGPGHGVVWMSYRFGRDDAIGGGGGEM